MTKVNTVLQKHKGLQQNEEHFHLQKKQVKIVSGVSTMYMFLNATDIYNKLFTKIKDQSWYLHPKVHEPLEKCHIKVLQLKHVLILTIVVPIFSFHFPSHVQIFSKPLHRRNVSTFHLSKIKQHLYSVSIYMLKGDTQKQTDLQISVNTVSFSETLSADVFPAVTSLMFDFNQTPRVLKVCQK